MFDCEVCKKTFGLKKTQYRHQRQIHENQKIESIVGYVVFEKTTKSISRKDLHQCEYCDFSTERIFNLKVHIKRKHEIVEEEKQVSVISATKQQHKKA